MTDKLSEIISYLNAMQRDVTVKAGYDDNYAKAPLLESRAFVYAERIEYGTLYFVISVHTPKSMGGTSCTAAAEGLSRLLFSYNALPGILSVKLDGVSYISQELAFSCDIHGAIEDSGQRRYFVTASNFSNQPGASITFGVNDIRIVREFNVLSIPVVFEDIPFDVSDGENIYEITLSDVPTEYTDLFSENGSFDLYIESEKFSRCCCIKSDEVKTGGRSLVIRGYKPKASNEGGTLPPNINF